MPTDDLPRPDDAAPGDVTGPWAPLADPDGVPQVRGTTVLLRRLEDADLPVLRAMVSEPDWVRWTTLSQPFGAVEAAAALDRARSGWATGRGWRWAVALPDDPTRLVGLTSLHRRDDGGATIGYGVRREVAGRGLATDAVRTACRYAFDRGIRRVHWDAFAGNWPSRRVAWAAGFTFHATVPEAGADRDGRTRDTWLASLGRDDDPAPTTPWFEPPVLDGAAIRLRPWRPADAAHCLPLADPAHFMPPNAAPTPDTFDTWVAVRHERMASGDGIYWCVADPATDLPLGAAMLFARPGPMTGPSAEVGYFLFPAARGRGVARAAVERVVAHAFSPVDGGGLGLARVSAVTAPDNLRSNAVLEATGFTRWGHEHRAWTLPDGTPGDGLHWERLA